MLIIFPREWYFTFCVDVNGEWKSMVIARGKKTRLGAKMQNNRRSCLTCSEIYIIFVFYLHIHAILSNLILRGYDLIRLEIESICILWKLIQYPGRKGKGATQMRIGNRVPRVLATGVLNILSYLGGIEYSLVSNVWKNCTRDMDSKQ